MQMNSGSSSARGVVGKFMNEHKLTVAMLS